jgi:hypothetical protein
MSYPGDVLCLTPAAALARFAIFGVIGLLLFSRPDIPLRGYMQCMHFVFVQMLRQEEQRLPEILRAEGVHSTELPRALSAPARVLRGIGILCLLLAAGRLVIMLLCAAGFFAA